VKDIQVKKKIWAVGGGKGGVGKSLVAANLGILLSRLNKKVVVVDTNMGGAAIHRFLNVEPPKAPYTDFIEGKVETFDDVRVSTPFENLQLINGAFDQDEIDQLPYEHIIIDIGAGTASETIDSFLLSDVGILIALPEPTSVENLYSFVKACFMRIIRSYICGFSNNTADLFRMFQQYADTKNSGFLQDTKELLMTIKKLDHFTYNKILWWIENFQLKLIMNQTREFEDIELGETIANMARKHFGLNMDYVGHLPHDDRVFKSAKKYRPFLSAHPYSMTTRCMKGITRRLLNGGSLIAREGTC
jgi:flagellar biosynthesis protein FlhG